MAHSTLGTMPAAIDPAFTCCLASAAVSSEPEKSAHKAKAKTHKAKAKSHGHESKEAAKATVK